VGELLAGKYKLEERLGSGGMGEVYRAHNVVIGRAVAIKILLADHSANDEVRKRFLREARAANLVRHPNVVDVQDVGHDEEGTPFIVQELLTGRDLQSVVDADGEKPMPMARVLELLLPVIDAVAFAHGKGVVHRDLKPANVFLANERGKVVPKLLDFGISHVAPTGTQGAEPRVTAAGAMLGTPWYMSPEQVRGVQEIDARTDVWALGVMLYQLVSGALPFEQSMGSALFVRICTEDPVPVASRVPGLPPDLATVIGRCMRRVPGERYPSALELAADLRLVEGGVSLVVPDLVLPPRTVIQTPMAPVQRASPAELRAAPTLAAVEANSFDADLARPPERAGPALPARGREPVAPKPGSRSSARPQGPNRPVFVDEPIQLEPVAPLRVSSSRPAARLEHRRAEAFSDPARRRSGSVEAGSIGRLVVLLLVVAAGVRGLTWAFPAGWPILGFVESVLHPLPDGAFGAFGLALGLGSISVCVGALRQSPVWWGLVVLGLGGATLSYSAFVSAIGWEGANPPVRELVRVGGALVPLAFGVLGVEMLFRARGSSDGWLQAVGISIAGFFLALQIARGPQVDAPVPPPAVRVHRP
jgi:serine/threonine protein kinase